MGGFLDTLKVIASPVTSAINAVTSLGSSLINRHSQKETNKSNQYLNDTNLSFNKEQNELTRQFNAEEAEKARQFNAEQAQLQFDRSADFEREMWNLQNEYNTPAAQIQRLKDAGINPNMFGTDGNTAGSVGSATSSAASSSPASASALGAPNAIPKQPLTLANPAFEAAQIRLANAEAKKAEQDANRTKELTPYEIDTEKAQARFVGVNADYVEKNKEKLNVEIDSLTKSIDVMNSEIATNKALAGLYSEQKEEKARANKLFDETFEYAVNEVKARYKLVLANIDEVRENMRLICARINEANAAANQSNAVANSYVYGNYWNGLRLDWLKNKGKTRSGKYDIEASLSAAWSADKWDFTLRSKTGQNASQREGWTGEYEWINGSQLLFETFGKALGPAAYTVGKFAPKP